MKIASWNVNSIKMRLPILLDWLQKESVDIVLLQEIKSLEKNFPTEEIQNLGYEIFIKEQKGFNGVAILSKKPMNLVLDTLPGDEDDSQARFLHVSGEECDVICIYLPNGNPVETEKYTYKLSWMKRLDQYAQTLLEQEKTFLIGGDFNVIPQKIDAYDPQAWEDDALYKYETKEAFRKLLYKGFVDAYRLLHPHNVAYSFWDYQAGRWSRDEGIRIDHFLLSPLAADKLESCEIKRDMRGLPKPSDHVPIVCELSV